MWPRRRFVIPSQTPPPTTQDDFAGAQRFSAVIQGKSQIELRENSKVVLDDQEQPLQAIEETEEKVAVSAARRSLSLQSLGSFAQDFRLEQSADDNDDPE
jgi:hypothetical protein